MAKNDNLTDFLTNVADAIRSKKGTSAKINPQNFANEIASIETGGGGGGNALPTAGVNDVTFYDYNGHILYSYSRSEFLALTEMPAPPSRDGLSFVEWTHTLEEAQEYVRLYRRLNIGACYTTSNGRTQIHFDVYSDENKQRKIAHSVDISSGVRIYYGDGRTGINSGTGGRTWTFNYETKGSYIIEIEVLNGAKVGLGRNQTSSAYPLFGSDQHGSVSSPYPTGAGLKKILCGDYISYCYPYFAALAWGLEEIILPMVSSLGSNALLYAGINCCVIPKTVESIEQKAFGSCEHLRVVVMPDTLSSLSSDLFYSCKALQSLNVPTSVAQLPAQMCIYCTNLEVVTIPKSVQSIGDSCFYSCNSLRLVNMSHHESVPTLGSSVFPSYYYMKIVVPDALYDDWKAAAGWSTYANYIVKASEYFVD